MSTTTHTPDPAVLAAVERLQSHLEASHKTIAGLLSDLSEAIDPYGPERVATYDQVECGDLVMWDQEWHVVNGAAIGETDGSAHLCFRDGSDCCDDRAANGIRLRKRLAP